MPEQGILIGENITKHFGGTTALDNVSFCLRAGEVHALMGENGAGKSTLGKIFSGVYKQDSGRIIFNGEEVKIENPHDAKEIGISIVLQEFNLLPDLTVAENLLITNDAFYSCRHSVLRKKAMNEHALELLKLFELDGTLHVHDKVEILSVAQMQMLEILKAVDSNAKVIILDEPTAALSPHEVSQLFDIVRRLKAEKNIGFIIVSHKIEEIFEIADRVTVLRDGKQILNGEEMTDMTEQKLVKSMVGREINDLYGSREFGTHKDDEVMLEVENICDTKGRVKNMSLKVRKGEIVGLTGIAGAGRSECARCILGVDKMKSGKVIVHGQEIPHPSLRKSIEAGIGFVTEDRKNDGLILDESIMQNISMVKQNMQKSPFLSTKKSREDAEEMKEKLNIKMGNMLDSCDSLSGGNQQKVLLGKWLTMNPDILIVDEPTRGIDISAKSEIYGILNNLSNNGVAILMISSEMPEIIGMCDRTIVMREGVNAGELDHSQMTEESIATLATINSGGTVNEE